MVRWVAVAAVLASCGPSGRTGDDSEMPGDSAMATPDMGPPVCYEQVTQVEVALSVQIEESCAIWNSLDKLAGTATVSRSGTTITIDFGEGVIFSGPLTNNMVMFVYTHDHPFSDGCGWRATETMRGTMDPVACTFALEYDYVESVVQNNGGCASPCAANADVTLDQSRDPLTSRDRHRHPQGPIVDAVFVVDAVHARFTRVRYHRDA